MKAITQDKYGTAEILEYKDVPMPIPEDNELLIRIHAASVNAYDWHLMRADPFVARFARGLFKPTNPTLGADVAGIVEAVGKNVTQFQPGDAVFGDLSSSGDGGFAEYVTAPEASMVAKPDEMTFEQAAAIPMAAVTALQGLRDVGQIQPGAQVLINGASGGVGTFAVQIAKLFGAEVTAVCSTTKVAQARALGADHVIDYTKEDFTRSGKQYDLILGVNGDRSLSEYEQALTPTGRYVMAGGTNKQIFQVVLFGSLRSKNGGRTLTNVSAKPNQADLAFVRDHIVAGDITPVIDRRFPLSQTADAIRYVERGHARGKVIITVAENGNGPDGQQSGSQP